MKFRDNIICILCVVLAVVLFIAAGMRLEYINSERFRMKLIINEPLENAPPSLAFATVAMGAFRGLVVDVLWLRADRLKQQGQFFDAKQLAEWITVLQPRFASVWEFQAWNMAYNISFAIPMTRPAERWRWVKNGYELLRDKGIVINPKSISLYRQLALIFQHKMGGVTDDVHKYYKLQLAQMMEPLLGEADHETFSALADAPGDWRQITADGNVVEFIEALKSADKVFEDEDKFVSSYLALRQHPGRFEPAAFKVIEMYRGTKELKKFDMFAKAWQLRNVWKLDPVLMQQLNQQFGPIDWDDPNTHLPLDWRHPDTHAMYWAVKGLQETAEQEYSIDQANADRIVYQSLQNLFHNGKIFIYNVPAEITPDSSLPKPPTKQIFVRSDLRMFEPYNQAMFARLEKYKTFKDKGKGKGTYQSMQIGHRNMISRALFNFYQAGHIRYAEKLYNQLRKLYPRDEFKVPLVAYMKSRLKEELQNLTFRSAKEMIQMMLRESYFRYALRDDDEAFGREKTAKEIYDLYRSIYRDENRIDLPDFKLLRYSALLDFFNDNRLPTNMRRNLLGRIKIERPELAEQLMQQEKKILKQKKK